MSEIKGQTHKIAGSVTLLALPTETLPIMLAVQPVRAEEWPGPAVRSHACQGSMIFSLMPGMKLRADYTDPQVG